MEDKMQTENPPNQANQSSRPRRNTKSVYARPRKPEAKTSRKAPKRPRKAKVPEKPFEEKDPEEQVLELQNFLEKLKEKVMSTGQKVKCLKISVSALKSQYMVEQEMLLAASGAPENSGTDG